MYRLIIAPQVQKELKVIKRFYSQPISLALQDIKENPYIGKPLGREFKGKFSYRVGLYRIIYIINEKDKIVNIISAGHRANVYK